MSFDPTWLFLSLIPSGIGFVLFVYGKKLQRWPHMVGGLALLIYPTSLRRLHHSLASTIGIALWYAVRLGW